MMSTISLMLAISSFGGIIFIISRKIPDIKNISDEELQKNPHPFHVASVYLVNKSKNFLSIWNREFFLKRLEKFLRKVKLVGMKLDRYAHNIILKIKKRNDVNNLDDQKDYVEKLKENADNIDGDNRQIENDLIKIITENPKNTKAYKELGKLYFKLKNYFDAKQSFLEVLKIDPEDEEAKKFLTYLGD